MSNKLVKTGPLGPKKNLFLCDPKKNVNCSGRYHPDHCQIECFCTTHPELSFDPSHPLTYEEYYRHQGKRMAWIKSKLSKR